MSSNPIWTIDRYQLLPLWVRVDLWAMAMNGYSILLKALALLLPHHEILVLFGVRSYHSAEMQSVYSTAPVNWTWYSPYSYREVVVEIGRFQLYMATSLREGKLIWKYLTPFKVWTSVAFFWHSLKLEQYGNVGNLKWSEYSTVTTGKYPPKSFAK